MSQSGVGEKKRSELRADSQAVQSINTCKYHKTVGTNTAAVKGEECGQLSEEDIW